MKKIGRWIVMWTLGGAVIGSVMAFWDESHLPSWAVPIVLAIAGGLGGLIGGAVFAIATRMGKITASRLSKTVVGALCGLVGGAALYFFGLGVTLPYCLVAGAVLGGLSAK